MNHYLTKNFTLEELTRSDKATATGLLNNPDQTQTAHLRELANTLQSLRDYYGKPIAISSAFRCQRINSLVGGSATSQHVTGYAADIRPSSHGTMTDLLQSVLAWSKTHQFDQIILEQCNTLGIPSWIHLGIKHVTKGQRRQYLLAKKVNGKWQYSNYQPK